MTILFGVLRLASIDSEPRSNSVGGPRVQDTTTSSPSKAFASSFRALVYLQASDCQGNLAVVRPILAMASAHAMLDVEIVDVSRAPSDSAIASLLPRSMRSFPLRRITPAERDRLEKLGSRESPVVLVVDDRERVRMLLTTESEPTLRVAQARAVRHLIEGDPGR
ncbi:hypothetical protein [Gemmatimonas sp. UBA7669]|uniref:hypothetical protein n=1 Tax=Gemmatimonas sp. UBA7669 TaxID=1946568 RepID=UPI0025B81E5B|nr:hypothetical protein [Gemmatimonas sp. UBA7669]